MNEDILPLEPAEVFHQRRLSEKEKVGFASGTKRFNTFMDDLVLKSTATPAPGSSAKLDTIGVQ